MRSTWIALLLVLSAACAGAPAKTPSGLGSPAAPSPAASAQSTPAASASHGAGKPSGEKLVGGKARGPFPSIMAWCASLTKDEPDAKCDLGVTVTVKTPAKPSPPFLEVRPLRVRAKMAGAPIVRCPLAMHTEAGWFVWNADLTCEGVHGPCSSMSNHAWEALATYTDGNSTRLRVESSHVLSSESYVDGPGGNPKGVSSQARFRQLSICGVNDAGVPSCIEPVVIECEEPPHAPVRFGVHLGDGAVVFSGQGACGANTELLEGRHELVFP